MKKLLGTILKGIAFFLGWAIAATFIPLLSTDVPAIWRLWAEATPLLAIVAFTFIFWLFEKRTISLHLFDNCKKGIVVGITGGAIWLGCTVLILLLLGTLSFDGSHVVSMLTVWIFAAFLNVIMQELLIRGYLYQMVKQRHNIVAATIVTTGIFTALHGGAFEAGLIPVLNVMTMSLLMTVVLEYTGSIIAPVIMHSIWNCVGGIILGGVSIADDYPHLLNISLSGNNILSGGSCKIEGSIIVLVINILLIGYFLYILRKRKV